MKLYGYFASSCFATGMSYAYGTVVVQKMDPLPSHYIADPILTSKNSATGKFGVGTSVLKMSLFSAVVLSVALQSNLWAWF